MKELGLAASDALILMNVRPTYIVQMLVDTLTRTASSIQWAHLFKMLEDKKVLQTLTLLDSCCVHDHDEVCTVWTEALGQLMNSPDGTIDSKACLLKADVKPHTVHAKTVLGGGLSASQGGMSDAEGGGEDSKTMSVNQLFNFGVTSMNGLPGADELYMFQHALDAELVQSARIGYVGRGWLLVDWKHIYSVFIHHNFIVTVTYMRILKTVVTYMHALRTDDLHSTNDII